MTLMIDLSQIGSDDVMFTSWVVSKANEINRLLPVHRACPLSDGGLDLYWFSESRKHYAFISIDNDQSMVVFLGNGPSRASECTEFSTTEIDLTVTRIKEWMI